MTTHELLGFQDFVSKLKRKNLISVYRSVLDEQDAAIGTRIDAAIFIKRAACEVELENRGLAESIRSSL